MNVGDSSSRPCPVYVPQLQSFEVTLSLGQLKWPVGIDEVVKGLSAIKPMMPSGPCNSTPHWSVSQAQKQKDNRRPARSFKGKSITHSGRLLRRLLALFSSSLLSGTPGCQQFLYTVLIKKPGRSSHDHSVWATQGSHRNPR